MSAFALSVYGACGLIVAIHVTLLIGGTRVRVRDWRAARHATAAGGSGSEQPALAPGLPVSVVVAARDEEHTLPPLLRSLEQQLSPDFEVVLVNDRSADGTAAIMQEFARRRPATIVVDNSDEPVGCNGKQHALDLGVAAASGELLLFTDADCELPPTWVDQHAARFADRRVAAVFGALAVRAGRKLVERYQAYDQALVHQYSTGTTGVGVPTGCFGNNLAVRSGALASVGGFRALGFTPTEDAALLAALQRTGLAVTATASVGTAIVTAPQTSWRAFLDQHVRWNSGAFYGDGVVGRWSYRYVVLFLVASILLAPLAAWWSQLALLPLTSFTVIALLGAFAAGSLRRGAAAGGSRISVLGMAFRVVAYTPLFMGFYALATVLAMAGVRPSWKGRRLQRARVGQRG